MRSAVLRTHPLPSLGRLPLLVCAIAAAPELVWLVRTFAHADHRLNLALLVAAVALVASSRVPSLAAAPAARPAPLALALAGAIALVASRAADLDVLAAMALGAALYGVLGLYLPPEPWRRARPAALLLVAVLPLATHLEVFLGFPARVLTAHLVTGALSAAGVTAASTETVLQLDGGAAHVDVPCAGLRSLWSGAVLLLFAAVAERRPADLRLAAVGFVLAVLLVAANAFRVGTLVVLDLVLGLPRAADLAHVPLGLVGFALSGVVAVALLRACPVPEPATAADSAPRPRGLPAAVALAALATLAVRAPDAPAAPPSMVLPLEPIALTPVERSFFADTGGAAAKWRVDGGSVLLVSSRSWRAHHLPEQCLSSGGERVEGAHTVWLAPDRPVRVARVGEGRTAIWWFQRRGATTDDHAARVWHEVVAGPEPWVMASLLIDERVRGDEPRVRAVLDPIHAAVAAELENPR